MKYSSRNTLPNIKGVRVSNTHEVFGFSDGTLWVDSEKIAERVDTTTGSLKFFNNSLFFDQENNAHIFDLKHKILFKTKQYRAYEKTLRDNIFICVYDTQIQGGKFTWRTGLYDFKGKELIKEYNFLQDVSIAHYLNEAFVITYLKPLGLGKISLLTGEYEWEVNLSGRKYMDTGEEKEATITQILGVWENQLLVVMNTSELISIDIQTGQILWSKADIYTKTLTDWRNMSQFWLNYWHLENGYLYNLDGNVYYRISLATQALEVLWQDDLGKEPYLTCIHKTYTKDYIYFTGSYNQALSPYLLGVFNRKTLQVEWLYDFGNQLASNKGGYPHSLNQPPQVAENKLYVLDSGGTLHIFEKE